jgi:hypothetical protein
MALSNKKYEEFYVTTGSGANKAASADITKAEKIWDLDRGEGCEWFLNHPEYSPLIFQLQQMWDEITSLRAEISANKDKTGISSGQTSAITANTAKVSNLFYGGSGTALSFGEMITTTHGKGNPATYSIVMTAVKSGVTKTVTLTLT